MSISYLVAFFHALSFFSSNSFTEARLTMIQAGADFDITGTIHIHIDVPSGAGPVSFTCRTQKFAANPGEDHEWKVALNKDETCQAIWGPLSSMFNAFDRDGDRGHNPVYWLVKSDGVYHSFDNANWEKRSTWN